MSKKTKRTRWCWLVLAAVPGGLVGWLHLKKRWNKMFFQYFPTAQREVSSPGWKLIRPDRNCCFVRPQVSGEQKSTTPLKKACVSCLFFLMDKQKTDWCSLLNTKPYQTKEFKLMSLRAWTLRWYPSWKEYRLYLSILDHPWDWKSYAHVPHSQMTHPSS